ncbi:DUF4136 domain-containing protein [Draconibacterium mangrovi]|uniref:DUF4136 domain-containing protein n=1 Tax=Draconibacterium mangrovi TaxID=2697469 RepID=UPI0013D6CD6D|nr:DUF4136 domain-containing protein [Draconibacterium mangrovi]
MNRNYPIFALLLFASAVLFSCHPEYDATVEELDVAITQYDEEQDFSQLQTFYLEDSIIYIKDEESGSASVDHSQNDLIVSLVRQNFLDMGWTEVTGPIDGEIDADVSIMLSVLETDLSFYYYYWWDWWYWYPWDWWYPWYGDPWYPGYPVWPSYPTYPSQGYTVGTLFIDMLDMNGVEMPEGDDSSFKVPMPWKGAAIGILAGSDTFLQQRLTNEINQVFKQSPYLQK